MTTSFVGGMPKCVMARTSSPRREGSVDGAIRFCEANEARTQSMHDSQRGILEHAHVGHAKIPTQSSPISILYPIDNIPTVPQRRLCLLPASSFVSGVLIYESTYIYLGNPGVDPGRSLATTCRPPTVAVHRATLLFFQQDGLCCSQ